MFLKGKSCLFIGQKKCKYSNECLSYLENFEMKITKVLSDRSLKKIPIDILNFKGDFIFSYRNFWLLSEPVINSAKIMALNFHPATPDFPGSGSYCWAIYKNVSVFGITIHLMNEKIDNGKILRVDKFRINKDISLNNLISLTLKKSVTSFKKFINYLNNQNNLRIEKILENKSIYNWNGKTKKLKDLELMRRLKINFTKEEVERRIKAFHFDNYPVYYELKGKKFYYKCN